MSEEGCAFGAYGFAVAGLPELREFLIEAPPHWPSVNLAVERTNHSVRPPEHVDDASAVVWLSSGGWVTLHREEQRAVFSLASVPPAEALVHPHLAAVAVVQSHWRRQDSFHAGAFVVDDGVWGLLGVKGAGKSSMLASLAATGISIMSDDLLVLAGSAALAGPRSLDLRAAAARQLGLGVALGRIGERERWRVSLGPVAPQLPFRGWVELHWGDSVDVRAKRGSDRLRALAPHRALRVSPAHPERLIDLSAMPVLELYRPAAWDSHERAIEALLDSVGSAGQPGRLQQGE